MKSIFIAFIFWAQAPQYTFALDVNASWQPVYSGFGGLSLYKLDSIINCSYSGIVTDDLKRYYEEILEEIPASNEHIKEYFRAIQFSKKRETKIPIVFQINTTWQQPKKNLSITCCEHLPFHASMALKGFNKFYINPKMRMQY